MHWQRVFLHPMLKAFDAPTREECSAKRSTSNTPLTALTLLNDPSFVEAARVFAERILKESGSCSDEQITWAWRQALNRNPSAEEKEALEELLQAEKSYYKENPEAAVELLSVGMRPHPDELDPVQTAALTSVARAIFNLNEWLTRN